MYLLFDIGGTQMRIGASKTGATLDVPMFVKEGDVVRINTETGEYVERV